MIHPLWPKLLRFFRPTVIVIAAVAVLPIAAFAAVPKTSAPVSVAAPAKARAFSTVVIDAGHGGHDRGKVPKIAAPEKTLTLDVAKRLQKILEGSGLRTVLTRTDDTFISLPQRVAVANAQSDAVFVSIHFNAGKRLGARGFETFFHRSNSLQLARGLHGGLLASAKTENRGIKRRGFYVLRYTRIPAVLLECGFLTNADEARMLQDPAFRQRLAESLAAALIASANQGRAA